MHNTNRGYSDYDEESGEEYYRKISIERMIPHENYNDDTYDTDIMLLKLSEKVDFNEAVQPVCLPDAGQRVEPGMKCFTTGWGHLEGL